MEKQNIRIKLRAYDNKILDASTEEIVNTVKRTGWQQLACFQTQIKKTLRLVKLEDQDGLVEDLILEEL